ncbi:MAG TPA: hypothetical protein VM617_07430 [Thermoanaerobaculia bacterium]|nr:hypothetical protein [Thermoanaerobaculia bacterium]
MSPRRPRCRISGLAALLVAAGLAASAAAQGASDLATRRLLELERRLLAEDLVALDAARAGAAEAAALLDELSESLAATAGGGSSTGLAGLEAALADAAQAQATASRRLDDALDGIGERLRRVRLLAAAVGVAGEGTVPDVLTGRWQVTISPGEVGGEFQLDQSGTLVAGSYRLDDGSRGSLEGTLASGLVRLRRIDLTSGFDSVFEARVEPAAGRLEGRWQATVLGRGGAGGGEWVAVRLPTTAVAIPEEEAAPGPDPDAPVGTEDSPPAGPVDEPPIEEEQ